MLALVNLLYHSQGAYKWFLHSTMLSEVLSLYLCYILLIMYRVCINNYNLKNVYCLMYGLFA